MALVMLSVECDEPFSIEVGKLDSIHDIKRRIHAARGIPVANQILKFGGETFTDDIFFLSTHSYDQKRIQLVVTAPPSQDSGATNEPRDFHDADRQNLADASHQPPPAAAAADPVVNQQYHTVNLGVEMVRGKKPKLQFRFQHPDSFNISSLVMETLADVGQLRTELAIKLHTRKIQLTVDLDGRRPRDSLVLLHSGINPRSRLSVTFPIATHTLNLDVQMVDWDSKLHLTFQTPNINTSSTLEIDLQAKIGQLRAELAQKLHTRKYLVTLIVDGNIRNDQLTLLQCGINNRSVLKVTFST